MGRDYPCSSPCRFLFLGILWLRFSDCESPRSHLGADRDEFLVDNLLQHLHQPLETHLVEGLCFKCHMPRQVAKDRWGSESPALKYWRTICVGKRGSLIEVSFSGQICARLSSLNFQALLGREKEGFTIRRQIIRWTYCFYNDIGWHVTQEQMASRSNGDTLLYSLFLSIDSAKLIFQC